MDVGGRNGERTEPGSPLGSPDLSNHDHQARPAHQRLVLTDPVAFRYLEEDPSITVLERRRRLQGYELYIVEQWICSRIHPTFVISTYTGLEQHSVLVGVISIPTDEDEWSPRLRVWFKALAKYHARKKETPLGTLMVTNLSGFPSALTVIPVPDGDVKAHREDFIINENMKRMGCSGRAGMNLAPPTAATQAKFNQLYHTSDRVTFYGAVIELVKLCQVALVLYGKLAPEYADGLICDVTEQAINDWWNDLGTEYFNIDPTDGILGPTTVAAILGILMGARNRLHTYGAPVAKDVFDTACTKRGIAYFQKSQKLERTRRLDLPTLKRLRNVTAKAASSEGWTVPRAVKTTVAELSGKGGDMVMGRVGAREKAGIADIETLDIETFISLISGERSKWLWYGKPRKSNNTEGLGTIGSEDGMVFTKDEKGGYIWSSQKRESVIDDSRTSALSNRIYSHHSHDSQTSLDTPEREQTLRHNVLKGVHGRMTDARTGLGRIKDAVGMAGFRGHHHKYSKEEPLVSDSESFKERPPRQSDEPSDKGDVSSAPKVTSMKDSDDSKEGSITSAKVASLPRETVESQRSSRDLPRQIEAEGNDAISVGSAESAGMFYPGEEGPGCPRQTADNLLALDISQKSADKRFDLWEDKSHEFRTDDHPQNDHAFPQTLRRTQSLSQTRDLDDADVHTLRWPRHLSFNTFIDVAAAQATSNWETSATVNPEQTQKQALAMENVMSRQAQSMAESLQRLKGLGGTIVESKVEEVITLDKQGGRDHEILESIYHEKLEGFNDLQAASEDLITEERHDLTENVRDIENLAAKFEYELDNFQSKVEDMENGIAEYERQVTQLETRAGELDQEKEESWFRGYLDFFIGKLDS